MKRRRVLFLCPPWPVPTGSNHVAIAIIEALAPVTDLTVLAWDGPDFEGANLAYGCHVDPRSFELLTLERLWNGWFGDRLWLLRHHLMLARARRMAPSFDVVFAANDESDFGRPGIQYMHYPRFDDPRVNSRSRREIEDYGLRWFHRSALLIRGYFRVCAAVSGFTMAGTCANLTLVNSDWTGRRARQVLDLETSTVYPPVRQDFREATWEARGDGFVCVGRFAPEKRHELVVEILDRVRARGRDVTLHIVGEPGDSECGNRIRRLAAARSGWLTLEGALSRSALVDLLGRNRWGIHGMAQEHFGMAVAEMASAGCIPFVPADGGQVEIVGGLGPLTFDTVDEAVEKISTLMDDAARQRAIRAELMRRCQDFAAGRFRDQIRRIVETFPERTFQAA